MNAAAAPKLPQIGMSPRDFARSAGIGLTTLYSEIGAGRLRAKKVGRRTIITAQEARRWLDSLPDMPAHGADAI